MAGDGAGGGAPRECGGHRATGSQILARLAELLAHKDREVRAAAIRAVEALGGAAATEPFLTRLAEMLDDKDWLVRAAAVQAVGALGGAVVTGPPAHGSWHAWPSCWTMRMSQYGKQPYGP